MITARHRNSFHITDLCGEKSFLTRIFLTKYGQGCGALTFHLLIAWTSSWTNSLFPKWTVIWDAGMHMFRHCTEIKFLRPNTKIWHTFRQDPDSKVICITMITHERRDASNHYQLDFLLENIFFWLYSVHCKILASHSYLQDRTKIFSMRNCIKYNSQYDCCCVCWCAVRVHHVMARNTFRIAGLLWGESTGHRILLTMDQKCRVWGSFVVSLDKLLNGESSYRLFDMTLKSLKWVSTRFSQLFSRNHLNLILKNTIISLIMTKHSRCRMHNDVRYSVQCLKGCLILVVIKQALHIKQYKTTPHLFLSEAVASFHQHLQCWPTLEVPS